MFLLELVDVPLIGCFFSSFVSFQVNCISRRLTKRYRRRNFRVACLSPFQTETLRSCRVVNIFICKYGTTKTPFLLSALINKIISCWTVSKIKDPSLPPNIVSLVDLSVRRRPIYLSGHVLVQVLQRLSGAHSSITRIVCRCISRVWAVCQGGESWQSEKTWKMSRFKTDHFRTTQIIHLTLITKDNDILKDSSYGPGIGSLIFAFSLCLQFCCCFF